MTEVPPPVHRHRAGGWGRRRTVILAAALAVVTTVATAAALTLTGPPPSPEAISPAAATGDAPVSAGPPASTPPSASASSSPSASASSVPATSGGCERPVGAGPVVRTTQVTLPAAVVGYGNEGDTAPLPMAMAATPSGESWLAWLGTDGRVHLGKLGCDDRLTGTPTSFTGVDLQDVQADGNGGVLLVTRAGECGDTPLCGGEASPCRTMVMIRFDATGQQVWERQVTNLGANRAGHDDGARFIWWYQHHGRLASDGTNVAAYFGVAITVRNGACADIHQGDRMQVVNASGGLVTGHDDAFEVGCSHAWTSRIVHDPRAKRFVTVCATDNGCRIAQPNPYRTIAAGTCDGTLFGGDLVLARTTGYWTAWSQGNRVRLEHFTTGASDTTVTTASTSQHPHLVSYGAGHMLLTWASGSGMAAQVYDSGTGKAVGAQFTIAAKDHDYQAFKGYADGSAAYPAAGTGGTGVTIARVLPIGGVQGLVVPALPSLG